MSRTRYPADATHRTCIDCKESYPLDTKEHFGVEARGPQGRRTRCKPCQQTKRKADDKARDFKMDSKQFAASLSKNRGYQAKARAKIAALPADEKAAAQKKRWLGSTASVDLPRYLEVMFAKAMTGPSETRRCDVEPAWKDFYKCVMEALRLYYDVSIAAREWDKNLCAMQASETWQLLDKANRTVRGYAYESVEYKTQKLVARFDDLTDDEMKRVKSHKRRPWVREELNFMSPQDRIELWAGIDSRSKANQERLDSRTPAEVELHDLTLDITLLIHDSWAVVDSGPRDSRLQRKWDQKSADKQATSANDILDNHPNQELVRQVRADMTESTRPTVTLSSPAAEDYMHDGDPEAKLIDAEEATQ